MRVRPLHFFAVLLAIAVLTLAGCEQKNENESETAENNSPANKSAQSEGAEAEPTGDDEPGNEASPSGDEQTDDGSGEGSAEAGSDEVEEAASRMNGREVADPRGYDNPEEAQLGTLPEGIGIEVGSTVPEFTALDVNQDPPAQVTSESLLAEGPVLMVFYRGGW